MRQKIQFALDIDSIDEAERYARDLSDYWDILEIGTILLLKEGMGCVKVFREVFQDADILVDTKIIDSGNQIAALACSVGANIITVLSAASEKTISNCVETAHSHNCMVLLDHLSEDWESQEFYEKCKLGIDFVGLHIPKDIQSDSPLNIEKLARIAGRIEKPISLAGGINPEMIRNLDGLPIHVFVVGGYLLNAEDKIQNAKMLHSEIDQLNEGQ